MISDPAAAAPPLEDILRRIRACRICRDAPQGAPLPHEPRPVLQAGAAARLCIASQAPGARAHASGKPFSDPSGVRLRAWMGVTEAEFYDESRVAIAPMGFCFPGYDAKGADRPPRRECAQAWRRPLFAALPRFELTLLVGGHAQAWHLPGGPALALTQNVAAWREAYEASPRLMPLPHPSWRNNGWLKRNPWFEEELLPELRRAVRIILDAGK